MSLAARPMYRWQLRTRTLELGSRTHLMAIINITPDSFSGDGLSKGSVEEAIDAAVRAHDNGADMLDLGAESTRPGATPITATEEQARLLPVLEGLMHERPQAVVSVDTYHASTARAAIRLGVEIVNDVSGLEWDSDMARTVADSGCGLVLMHTRGRPAQWKLQTRLPPQSSSRRLFRPVRTPDAGRSFRPLQRAHPHRSRLWLRQGRQRKMVLLAGLGQGLHELGRPLLVGLSRKSFLANLVPNVQSASLPIPEARSVATIAANVAAILAGAHVLRVHDLSRPRSCRRRRRLLEAEEPTLKKVGRLRRLKFSNRPSTASLDRHYLFFLRLEHLFDRLIARRSSAESLRSRASRRRPKSACPSSPSSPCRCRRGGYCGRTSMILEARSRGVSPYPASLLVHRRNRHADNLAVVHRVESQAGRADRLLNRRHHRRSHGSTTISCASGVFNWATCDSGTSVP